MVESEKVYQGFTYLMLVVLPVMVIFSIVILVIREPDKEVTTAGSSTLLGMSDVNIDASSLQNKQILSFNNVTQRFEAGEATIADTDAVTPITGGANYTNPVGLTAAATTVYDFRVFDRLVCYDLTVTCTSNSFGGPNPNCPFWDMSAIPELVPLLPAEIQGTTTFVPRTATFDFENPSLVWLRPSGVWAISDLRNGETIRITGQYTLPPLP